MCFNVVFKNLTDKRSGDKERKYFEGLDLIRALAALLVIDHHIELTVYLEFGHVEELGLFRKCGIFTYGKKRGPFFFFVVWVSYHLFTHSREVRTEAYCHW